MADDSALGHASRRDDPRWHCASSDADLVRRVRARCRSPRSVIAEDDERLRALRGPAPGVTRPEALRAREQRETPEALRQAGRKNCVLPYSQEARGAFNDLSGCRLFPHRQIVRTCRTDQKLSFRNHSGETHISAKAGISSIAVRNCGFRPCRLGSRRPRRLSSASISSSP